MRDLDFRSPLDDLSLGRRLLAALREFWHPTPTPNLVLDSKPIRVKDIWSHDEHSLRTRATSVIIHLAVIGILLLPLWRPVRRQIAHRVDQVVPLLVPGPSLPQMKHLAGGGSPLPRPRMVPPKSVAPPQPVIPPLQLAPLITASNLPIPSLASLGPVGGPPGSSVGNGGAGPGGPGSGNGGGTCTDEPCGTGGGITDPVPIYEPDPEYSDAARKAKFQGTVVVAVLIGSDGHVYQPRVVQSLGLGLDQKALDAVRLWRFEPARRDGKPIPVAANIEVNFHLY